MDNYKTIVVVYVKQIDIKLIKPRKLQNPTILIFRLGMLLISCSTTCKTKPG